MIVILRRRYLAAAAAVLLLAGAAAVLRPGCPAAVNAAGAGCRTIVLDAGHGGEDGGAVSPDGVVESDLNLAITRRLRDVLLFLGRDTVLTRTGEDAIYSPEAVTLREKKVSDLKNRVALINSQPEAVLISIHQNSYSAEYVHGAQVFYYSTSSGGKALAECIQEHLISEADPSNTRAAKGNSEYLVLRESPCTAVIVECGFLSNTKECSDLCNDEYQTALANAICNAVCTWHEQHAK